MTSFPSLIITPADGDPLDLPAALAGHFGVALLYRGGWCPYCNAQLRAFRRAADQLAEQRQVCARAPGPRGRGMSGVLVERETGVLCRLTEAARVRPRG